MVKIRQIDKETQQDIAKRIKTNPQLKKDIDYVDLCTLEDFQSGSGGKKDWSFSDLEKDKYICYRTGYTNEHHKDRGPVFPGVQNKETGKWLPCKIYESDISYAIFFILVVSNNPSRIYQLFVSFYTYLL